MAQPALPQYTGYPPQQDAAKPEGDLPIKEHWSRRKHETAIGSFRVRGLFKPKFIKYWVLLILLLVAVALFTVYHHAIVGWLRPRAEQLQDLPGGWAIVVAVLFVISFPPLFGHEIVAVLCGLVGFAIVAAGTLLGELGNWFLFKYWLADKARAKEKTDVTYASMARVIREGGFKIVLYARLSAIPGHLTTPLFAVNGMSLWVFTISAILSLPKQLLPVYLGTIFDQEEAGTRTTASKLVQWAIIGLGFFLTFWTAWYIWAKLKEVRPLVAAEIKANKAAGPDLTEAHALRYEAQATGPPPRLTTRSGGVNPFARQTASADDAEAGLVQHSIPPAGFAPTQPYDNPYSARSTTTFGGSEVSLHEAPLRHDNPYGRHHGADVSSEDLDYPVRPAYLASEYDAPTTRAPSYRTHA